MSICMQIRIQRIQFGMGDDLMKKVSFLKIGILNFVAAICFVTATVIPDSTSSYGLLIPAFLLVVTGVFNVMAHVKRNT